MNSPFQCFLDLDAHKSCNCLVIDKITLWYFYMGSWIFRTLLSIRLKSEQIWFCWSSGNYIVVDRVAIILLIEWLLCCCWSSSNDVVVDRVAMILLLIEWQLCCCWSSSNYIVVDRVEIILLLIDCRSSDNYIVVDRVTIILLLI